MSFSKPNTPRVIQTIRLSYLKRVNKVFLYNQIWGQTWNGKRNSTLCHLQRTLTKTCVFVVIVFFLVYNIFTERINIQVEWPLDSIHCRFLLNKGENDATISKLIWALSQTLYVRACGLSYSSPPLTPNYIKYTNKK